MELLGAYCIFLVSGFSSVRILRQSDLKLSTSIIEKTIEEFKRESSQGVKAKKFGASVIWKLPINPYIDVKQSRIGSSPMEFIGIGRIPIK